MRILSFSALVLLLMLSAGRTALACDCVTGTPQQSFEEADLVFEGELIRSANLGQNAQSWQNMTYTLEVSKLFKGPSLKEITIVGGESNCDYNFSPNTVYRVYARNYDGKWITGACFGNQVLRTRQLGGSHAGFQTFRWVWPIKTLAIAAIVLVSLLIILFAAKGLGPKRT